MANMTPMMRQYLEMKEKYPGMILFFRLGDFYEMFFDDAKLVSRELELTLTGKSCGMEERAPMCGVPFHSAETYINRLIEKGYKVAICEQMEDPATAKGLVKRDVIRIVTPGTVIEQSMLDERRNSYLLSVCLEGSKAGLAFADVSTGEFFLYEIDKAASRLQDELVRISPKEIIANAQLPQGATALPVDVRDSSGFQFGKAKAALFAHFGVQSLEALGVEGLRLGVRAAGALMHYLDETQKNALEHITTLRRYYDKRYMMLDHTARRNLELTETMRSRQKQGTLLGILDYTCTAMGGRMLRGFIEQPLAVREEIERRLEAVSALAGADMTAALLRDELSAVYDVERLLSRISYRSINAKDCLALRDSLSHVPAIREALASLSPAGQLAELLEGLEPLDDIVDLLTRAIDPDAPALMSDGHYIREGYNAELDKLRSASANGKQWIAELEAKERELTKIKNLKIQYNKVFGYYIEVTKSFYDQVPYRYTRKQTLANCERYMTPELHEIEETVLGAQEKSLRLEQGLFIEIRDFLSRQISRMQRTAEALKTIDALLSLATAAVRHHYVRPEITEDGVIDIQNGRHPVVEDGLSGEEPFVPNSTLMDCGDNRMLIITGPNMAGKSTYMRQVALITLMAHMGSFVPADSARIGIVDRIFTRVGASDDLASGQSTFMVEMNEMAHILRSATPRSLIVLDEIGRGTSTFDGLSIAWAVVEYLVDKQKIGAKTLFATHYHELSELEGSLSGVVNYRISVKEHGESVIFLRKIERGGADKSFGIHVAHLAGLPRPVIMRAHEILARIEANDVNQTSIGQNILGTDADRAPQQVGLFESPAMDLVEELRSLDVLSMTPIDALNTLFALKEKARKI
ncbi:MAG: DNA mismatch repair protein MutS [Clostridiales bacterium]|nr:DNA mismatch repair protein MutS [Clostridiales bacterium]MDY5513952.1 DNA mismatch repair protein MutS [Candidatus Ventricola sp.]